MTTPAPTLDGVLATAEGAARTLALSSPVERADWLAALADALDAAGPELIATAQAETSLPTGRLTGELARTTFQARLFAERLRDGSLLEARIDHADPAWPMGPRPDIRRALRPLGVVVVFAASNFPFAFSVAGGDTVSALAAGCPVVLKAHPGHPRLSRETAAVVVAALESAGAPAGVFALIEGFEDGIAAVRDPRVSAVGFTGSVSGGRALFDVAVGRPVPIPFYGELGSTNPVFVTPRGWQDRGAEIVEGFAGSVTLGSGQFCTKPGVVLVPDVDAFVGLLPELTVGPMLNERIQTGFLTATGGLADCDGVDTVPTVAGADSAVAPVLLRTTAERVLADPELLGMECFGPAALLVSYSSTEELLAVARLGHGQLTATIQGSEAGDDVAAELVEPLSDFAGRIIWNQWPTGVTVSDAQHHGGPYPASTAPTTTSVGTAAVTRFLRPVAYQNLPAALLPAAVGDAAAEGVRQVIDGRQA
ncbi:NAD-dependent aldehyde dehydrogenase [Actinoalloteichus sp. GBA129-24]|uniref:NAD-dependent aldehyde dehydrogenase n=1 Tax=Actinoalloteichus fjordicus TaxID=1612552 RepID=A0AAC9LB97_9PSEU|nr:MULTISPECIES: aldehyde dehydrogenase (NADP(+)) [Actinoalloteichus]APU14748.1 NAD-dependent aldehyde dehydrogenase [Actinoalloteichus fjordicus]APU20717.1 NAD-dependent aldehyde dehydrogenase [Actinoalloteichus sp. GBA129-24]